MWREVSDDSLRNYGREYIFAEPLYGTGITDALVDMAFFMDEVKPSITYRCSVHVHLNVSDMEAEQLLTLLTLYLIFERTLVKYHGGSREDNIFCVPYYKAPESMVNLQWLYQDAMEGRLSAGTVGSMLSDFQKYNALNIGAVMTHGSLEFRHMPGTTDMNKVFEWIKIIQYMKRAALEGDIDYMELVHGASGHTSSLLERVFQDTAEVLKYRDMTNDIMAGARLAQRMINGSKFGTTTEEEIGRRYNKSTREKIDKIKAKIRSTSKGKTTKPSPQQGQVDDDYLATPSRGFFDLRGTTATETVTDDTVRATQEEIDAFLRSLDELQQRGTE